MFETFGFEETTARQASVLFALGLGLVFGALAQLTRFCLRRTIDGSDRREAAGVWAMALAVAVLGTQAAVLQGWISFDEHRLLAADLPVLAIIDSGPNAGDLSPAGFSCQIGCCGHISFQICNRRSLVCDCGRRPIGTNRKLGQERS